jgi:hypothetical protein
MLIRQNFLNEKIATTQTINCDIPVTNGKFFNSKDFWLPGNKTYTLVIHYPFDKKARYDVKTKKGMGLAGLLRQIYKYYVKKYKTADTANNDGYCHGIEDLMVEGIRVNHKSRIIKLDIGS